jgi:FkbH-like protein
MMAEANPAVLLVSDFNMGNLASLLEADGSAPMVEARRSTFGDVLPILLSADHECWTPEPAGAVVWTRPEGVLPSFSGATRPGAHDKETVLGEVDAYADALARCADRLGWILVPSWVHPTFDRGYGMLDMHPDHGIAHLLSRLNLRLADRLVSAPNVFVLNAQKWIERGGPGAFDPKLWHMAKVPFGNSVLREAVLDIKAAMRGLGGQARKLLIVDLDDTLWGGIVGDLGWEQLRLGGHDPVGEAFVDFQRALKSLSERGVLLGIASKNEEAVALEAIRRHPEMVLTPSDFVGWRIDWSDKAANIVDLVADLNLGLESVVFIDDDPAERARVRAALPEVLVPEWPANKMRYASSLQSLRCFDVPSMSDEDRSRTQAYAAERKREDLRRELASLESWIESLDLRVRVEELSTENLPRATQLLNKTNQMNLSTRRLTEPEFARWAQEGGHRVWTFRVSDRFQDAGLTGIASLDVSEATGRIVDFVLSCRVFSRNIERVMLAVLVDGARAHGARTVEAVYEPTPRNKPCLEFWQHRSGFSQDEDLSRFTWNAEREYEPPPGIEVTRGPDHPRSD